MTHPSPSPRPRAATNAVVVALAFCLGGATTYFATAPSALAATVIAGIDGADGLARLHSGHSHAELHAHFDQALTRAGVDDARKQQIAAIVTGAMQAEHADMRRYHATWVSLEQLLAAPRIDVGAVEKVRAGQDALFVDTSRRLSETAVQIARTLTPAQRQALSTEIDHMVANGHHAQD